MLTLATTLPPVPVLETERLILRGYQPSDFDALHALWNNENVYRYISGHPSNAGETQTRLLRYIGHWATFGFGSWAVESRESGAVVGNVGFGQYRRAILPSIDAMPEIGWVLCPSVHGQGIATEAARACIAWADANFGDLKTCCIFHPENTGSIRVAEKLGYRFWKMGQFMGDSPIYVRAAPDHP